MSNISIFIAHEGCPQNCSFCNQRIISGQSEHIDAQKVSEILKSALAQMGTRSKSAQIAFFGGSFTAVDREYMLELLEATVPYIKHFNGIRISTRPDAIDEEILDILKKYSVKAIELGAQSMCDDVLLLNKRGHTSEDVVSAARLIKSYGFELGVQMMTGLYGSDDEKDIYTAQRLIELSPDTVRIYPTVTLRGTELDRLYKRGLYKPQSLEDGVNLCVRLIPLFENAGVKIIRLGLHASVDIEKNYVGGAYHQAFKELCLSKIYLEKEKKLLFPLNKGGYTLYVNPAGISQAVGQHRSNIRELKHLGYDIKIKTDSKLKKYEVRI